MIEVLDDAIDKWEAGRDSWIIVYDILREESSCVLECNFPDYV